MTEKRDGDCRGEGVRPGAWHLWNTNGRCTWCGTPAPRKPRQRSSAPAYADERRGADPAWDVDDGRLEELDGFSPAWDVDRTWDEPGLFGRSV